MKIGVLSDTHLRRVTDDFKRLCREHFGDTDLVLHAGDMVALPVYEFLTSFKVEAVQGNMDEGPLVGRLPTQKTFTFGEWKIGLIHGWGSPKGLEDRLRAQFEDLHCLVYGHSHQAVNCRRDGLLFFNPGTATGAGFFGRSTLGFLYLDESGIRGEIKEL